MVPLELEAWKKDLENLLIGCDKLREDMIQSFDSCLALRPQRKDYINSIMELTHLHIMQVQGNFWEVIGIEMSPFETLSLIDWNYSYYQDLRRFGVRDDSLYNGFI